MDEKLIKVKEMNPNRRHGLYGETVGRIGTIVREKTRSYNSGFKFAVKFDNLKNPSSQYGIFYYSLEEIEFVKEINIDTDKLINLLQQ